MYPASTKSFTDRACQNAVRSINRIEHAVAVEVNYDNLYNNPGVYPQRQVIVEHPFSPFKR